MPCSAGLRRIRCIGASCASAHPVQTPDVDAPMHRLRRCSHPSPSESIQVHPSLSESIRVPGARPPGSAERPEAARDPRPFNQWLAQPWRGSAWGPSPPAVRAATHFSPHHRSAPTPRNRWQHGPAPSPLGPSHGTRMARRRECGFRGEAGRGEAGGAGRESAGGGGGGLA